MIVVPVPWRLLLLLKFVTRKPRGTRATPYGLTSPLAGIVEIELSGEVGNRLMNEVVDWAAETAAVATWLEGAIVALKSSRLSSDSHAGSNFRRIVSERARMAHSAEVFKEANSKRDLMFI
jgi:hypothetical protein